nr:ABC transporter ATP-binding protein [bacterium]
MQPILECRGLTKFYGGMPALTGVNLQIPKGRIVGLLGPNGSGKTTLLKLCAGLLTPTGGQLLIDGREIGVETKAVVSYLPDSTYLSSWMRIQDCLDYFADFYADFDRRRAEGMLELLQIPANARMRTLSKGTKEKVQLVLVMSRRAKLYLLDEPIAGVDPAARDFILNTIISNYSEDATVLISTHLIADIEKVLDDCIFISHGQIARYDAVDDLRAQTGKSVDEVFREVFRC